MRLLVLIATCCPLVACKHGSKDTAPCDVAIPQSELESMFGKPLSRHEATIAAGDCRVSWRTPQERAFVTIEIEVDRTDDRNSGFAKQIHESQKQPFSVVEDRKGDGYTVHSVLSLPTDVQEKAAHDQANADLEKVTAEREHHSADPMGDILAKGPSDLHDVEITTAQAKVYVKLSRFSTTREQVTKLTDAIAKAIVASK